VERRGSKAARAGGAGISNGERRDLRKERGSAEYSESQQRKTKRSGLGGHAALEGEEDEVGAAADTEFVE